MKTAYIVPLSGGLDSTYLLYKLLQEGNDVFVMHVSLKKKGEYYWKQELKAFRKIVKWCKINCSGEIVDVRKSVINMMEFPFGYDTDGILLMAQKYCYRICKRFDYDDVRVAFGAVGDDDPYTEERYKKGYGVALWNALIDSMTGRTHYKRFKAINRKTFSPLYHPTKLYKKDIVNLIPKELLDMVWTCRHPNKQTGEPCERCGSCRKYINALSYIKEV